MTQTALDDIINHARYAVRHFATVDEAVAGFQFVSPTAACLALQDSRFIAFCKEQDMLKAGYTKAGTNWIKDIKVFGEPHHLQTWQEDH